MSRPDHVNQAASYHSEGDRTGYVLPGCVALGFGLLEIFVVVCRCVGLAPGQRCEKSIWLEAEKVSCHSWLS